MKIADGTEADGIKYTCQLVGEQWKITVTHPNGKQLTEGFPWTYPPVAGPDVADVATAENIMDRLIAEIRATQ